MCHTQDPGIGSFYLPKPGYEVWGLKYKNKINEQNMFLMCNFDLFKITKLFTNTQIKHFILISLFYDHLIILILDFKTYKIYRGVSSICDPVET